MPRLPFSGNDPDRPAIPEGAESEIGSFYEFRRARDVTIYNQQGPAYRLEGFPCEAPPIPRESLDQPSRLLAARYRVVHFIGRTAELRELTDWRDDRGHDIAVRLLHGPGGEGKTRLAAEFAAASAQGGWAVAQAVNTTYKLRAGTVGRFRLRAGKRLLLLIDYAERWPLTSLFDMIRDPLLRNVTSLRVLLLARPVGEWWEPLKYDLTENGVKADRIPLRPLADNLDTRFRAFNEARDRFADILQAGGAGRTSLSAGMFADDAFQKVLTIHMTALADVQAGLRGDAAPSDPAAVSEYLLERERDHWSKLYRSSDDFRTRPKVMARAVYTAILTRPLPFDTALGVLERTGIATAAETASQILDDHSTCYPPTTGEVLEPLYPDRLGEDFLALQTPGGAATAAPDKWAKTAIATLLALEDGEPTPEWARQAVTILVEASRRWRHLATQQLYPLICARPWLAVAAGGQALSGLAELPDIGLDVLRAVEQQFPSGQRVDLDVGIAAVTARTASLLLPRTTDGAERGDLYLKVGWRRANAGLFEEAVQACEQAVQAYERLAPTERAESGLARALDELGNALSGLGRREPALAACERAVATYRRLAAMPGVGAGRYESGLAASLVDLGRELWYSGRRKEALAATDESVRIYRRLAGRLESAPAPGRGEAMELHSRLARSLRNLGVMLDDGQPARGLAATQEAVDILRPLAEADPPAYERELAMALSNLGADLADLQGPEAGLEPAQQAVEIGRRLVRVNPAVIERSLMLWLTNLGRRLSDLGRLPEARAAIADALAIQRQLVRVTPVSYEVNLAEALDSLAVSMMQHDMRREAMRATEEAVGVWRQLAQDLPGDYEADLAYSLHRLADVRKLAETELAEALSAAEEAMAIYQKLAGEEPAAYRDDLSDASSMVADLLIRLGRQPEAEAILRSGVLPAEPGAESPDLTSDETSGAALWEPLPASSHLADVEAVLREAAGRGDWVDRVREAVSSGGVYGLGQPSGDTSVAGHGTESDLLHFIIDNPDGGESTMLPVFTNPVAMRDSLIRNPDWQQLSVLEIDGGALLANVDDDVIVVVNPWSDLEYQLPSRDSSPN
jgi:tetratricopeptide (TPR) repeat protein